MAINNSEIIDLTDETDHLTSLPPELLHLVFDFLLPAHEPDIAFEDGAHRPNDHALDNLAATCQSLHEEVHSWAKHWMTSHGSLTKYKDLKTAKLQQKRDHLRGRGGLLTWAESRCVFCGKASSRSAILANGLKCCAGCDREQWPDKITKTNAKAEYDLKDHHLLRPGDSGLPKVRYGTYLSCNVPTTMFLRSEIEVLAQAVHGDVKAHMKEKKAATEERKRKKEAKAEKKRRDSLEKIKQSSPFKYARESGGSNEAAALELQGLLEYHELTVDELVDGNLLLRKHLGL